MARFVFFSLLIISVHLPALAQHAANATLNGTVTDPMGAAVAGTKISATQTATGLTRDAISNEAGFFVFANMTPGDYELRFDAKGFALAIITAVTLNVG